MITIYQPCRKCISMALCRHKDWVNILHTCKPLRIRLLELSPKILEYGRETHVRVPPIKLEIEIYMDSKGKLTVSPWTRRL